MEPRMNANEREWPAGLLRACLRIRPVRRPGLQLGQLPQFSVGRVPSRGVLMEFSNRLLDTPGQNSIPRPRPTPIHEGVGTARPQFFA